MGLWTRRFREDRPWRIDVRSRAGEIRNAAVGAAVARGCTYVDGNVVPGGRDGDRVARLANEVLALAGRAERLASGQHGPVAWLSGAVVEGAWSALHSAERLLLAFLPDDGIRGRLPVVSYQVRRYLRRTDAQRVAVLARARALRGGGAVTDTDRALLADVLASVHLRSSASYRRIRSLRNTQLAFALVFLLVAVVLAVAGSVGPDGKPPLSLCVGAEETQICPAGRAGTPATGADAEAAVPDLPSDRDVPLVELFGMLGAAIAAARAVTGTKRPAAPYAIVVAQSLLKITLGAVVAVVGVLFLGAGFVPGVDDVESRRDILVWAVIFGYAQQLLTQIIDNRSSAAAEATTRTTPDAPAEDDEEPAE